MVWGTMAMTSGRSLTIVSGWAIGLGWGAGITVVGRGVGVVGVGRGVGVAIGAGVAIGVGVRSRLDFVAEVLGWWRVR
ncbi:MAG: hypothetical protein HC860_13240 [Alkalinema sp. RU_4_3]|nr:hypothetical protein [Alkalinema sp. RU_4_3]